MVSTLETELEIDDHGVLAGRRVVGALARHWLAICAVTMLAAVCAFALASPGPTRYQAESRLLMEHRDLNAGERRGPTDGEPVASLVQLLTSRDLARRIAERHRMGDRAEFSGTSGSALDGVLIALGFGRDPMRVSPEERVIDAFMERLRVAQVEGSRVLVVAFTSTDPALATAVVNSLASEYLTLQNDASRRSDELGASRVGARSEALLEARVIGRAAVKAQSTAGMALPLAAGSALVAFLICIAVFALRELLSTGNRAQSMEPPATPVALETIGLDSGSAVAQPGRSARAGRRTRTVAAGAVARGRNSDVESSAPQPIHADVEAVAAVLIADGATRVAMMSIGGSEQLATIVENLARAATAGGTRVVIVDTDGANAGRSGPGLSDLIAGNAAFGEIIRRGRPTRTHEIGVGSRPLEDGELDFGALETTLDALASAYDLVVLSLGGTESGLDRCLARQRILAATDHVVLVGAADDERLPGARRWLAKRGCTAVSLLAPPLPCGVGEAA